MYLAIRDRRSSIQKIFLLQFSSYSCWLLKPLHLIKIDVTINQAKMHD